MEEIFFPLTYALLIVLGLLFLAGLISVWRIAARDEGIRRNLSCPVQMMSVAGLAIAFICSLVVICPALLNLSAMTTTREFEKVECNETPITDSYKMVVTKRRDGTVEASVDGVDGEGGFIWVREYAVIDGHLMGISNGSYFWIDPRTRGQRIIDERINYVDFLNTQGIKSMPEFLPAETICQTRQCQPCPKK